MPNDFDPIIPLSESAPPAVERGPSPAYPLGPEFLALVSDMSARILAGTIATAQIEFTTQRAAELAVEMAVAVANEARLYRLVDNKAVKVING